MSPISSMKDQFKLTSQRLGQLQAKNDSRAAIVRKDIATLLQQGQITLARVKAHRLIQEDWLGDLLEELEMQLGAIVEHFSELEQNSKPSSIIIEAASSIIYAAPEVQSKDLDIIRVALVEHFGPDFTRSAMKNLDHTVSPGVLRPLSIGIPSARTLDNYLYSIAKTYNIQWSPDTQRHDIVDLLSEILDPDGSTIVDLAHLRSLCARGIPEEPVWLRPRVWKLLFGILSTSKSSWSTDIKKQRDSYYDLMRRVLTPLLQLSSKRNSYTPADETLLEVYRQLCRVPHGLFGLLKMKPDVVTDFPMGTEYATVLDQRLKALRHRSTANEGLTIPEIQLEVEVDSTSGDSYSSLDGPQPPELLLESMAYSFGNAHYRHCSILVRMLYMHFAVNPGNLSQHAASILVPLYSVMIQEIDSEDLIHVEADTFWLFEAVVGEISELEDDNGKPWIIQFDSRLAWADKELFDNLVLKGLEPASQHYSHRWLAPLLAHTLPLTSVIPVWDVMFSYQMRERNYNAKLDCLLDICTGMLICARSMLLQPGLKNRKLGLWNDENTWPSVATLDSNEIGSAFLEGISILQLYPVEAVGGIERVIQEAVELSLRRNRENNSTKTDKTTLGARWKVAVWKGFTNQVTSPIASPVDSDIEEEPSHDDGNDTETPGKSMTYTLTSQLATTVWRGITNQTSMEAPPSPTSPLPSPNSSPLFPTPPSHPAPEKNEPANAQEPSGSSIIWGYAEKLKDSDTVATLAKVSSNWRAKALMSTWGLGSKIQHERQLSDGKAVQSESGSPKVASFSQERRSSLPVSDRSNIYSPPPRPSFFRPPRDSFIANNPIIPHSPPSSQEKSSSIISLFGQQTKGRDSPVQHPTPTSAKNGPKPLLLGNLINSAQRDSGNERYASSNPPSDSERWAEVLKSKNKHLHTESQSSISSLSPSDALGRPLVSYRKESDLNPSPSSRIVPLNRRSISPMAPISRLSQARPPQKVSPTSSDDRNSWSQVTSPDSAIQNTNQSPDGLNLESYHITSPSHVRSPSEVFNDTDSLSQGPATITRKINRRKPMVSQDTSDSSVAAVSPTSTRLRSKRYNSKPSSLQISNSISKSVDHKMANLNVDWPSSDQEQSLTPTATGFTVENNDTTPQRPKHGLKVSTDTQERPRKISTDGQEILPRKVSSSSRTRKVSTENIRKNRDSAAEEGDDEGYDDLLSAYESEESSTMSVLR